MGLIPTHHAGDSEVRQKWEYLIPKSIHPSALIDDSKYNLQQRAWPNGFGPEQMAIQDRSRSQKQTATRNWL